MCGSIEQRPAPAGAPWYHGRRQDSNVQCSAHAVGLAGLRSIHPRLSCGTGGQPEARV